MHQSCKRLIVMFQSWGQMLSTSSVFSVLYRELLCKSIKNTQHHSFWAQVIMRAFRYWAYLMACPSYLAVCLPCWWDASIPTSWVSWTANPSFFICRAVLLQCGFCVCTSTAGSRVLCTLVVLLQPPVCPWNGHCEWPTHTTASLVLYCIISLKHNIIFYFFIWDAVTYGCSNCWDFFWYLCWWPLNY